MKALAYSSCLILILVVLTSAGFILRESIREKHSLVQLARNYLESRHLPPPSLVVLPPPSVSPQPSAVLGSQIAVLSGNSCTSLVDYLFCRFSQVVGLQKIVFYPHFPQIMPAP